MSDERIRQLSLQYGYTVAASSLCEEAALLETAPQQTPLATAICNDLAKRLRKQADVLRAQAIQLAEGGQCELKH